MPRVVRLNFKSGVLPKPRQVVPPRLTSYEQAEQAKIPTGFKDPQMAPKGSSPNPPVKQPKSAAEKIAASAKPPRPNKVETASEQAQWKKHIAEVRRSYLESSLLTYEQQEEKYKQIREERKKASDESVSTKLQQSTQTVAEALTTPTIESSLLADFVEPRTEEQQEELRLKRSYNRKLTEMNKLVNKQEKLLQLYQDTAQYIVTEKQLEDEISQKFKPEVSIPSMGTSKFQTPDWWKYINNDPARVLAAKEQDREMQLLDALQGTVRAGTRADSVTEQRLPGFKAVRNALKEKK